MKADEEPKRVLHREERSYESRAKGHDKGAFSRFVREGRRAIVENHCGGMSTRELAEKVGIGYEQFRKMVNGQKPITKRDFVIAVCAMLRLDADEANEALDMQDMLPLGKDRARDAEIMDVLDLQLSDCLTIEQINRRLVARGFEELDVIDRRGPSYASLSQCPFRVSKESVVCEVDELLYCDPYDSLETVYHPGRYHILATMWVRDDVERRLFVLRAEPTGRFSMDTYTHDTWKPEGFKSIDETGVFRPCFERLQGKAREELARMANRLHDTRNYRSRRSARVIDGSVHIFLERYNYAVPEWGEYYLMDYSDGEFRLSVSRQSQFMGRYLSAADYEKYYGRGLPKAKELYRSTEEIQEKVDAPSLSWNKKEVLKLRLAAYKRMSEELEAFVGDLRAGKAHICNAEAIFGGVYYDYRFGVLESFGLTEAFGCVRDDANEICATSTPSIGVVLADGPTIQLSLDDLTSGFELGLGSPEEIAAFLKENGTLSIVDLL